MDKKQCKQPETFAKYYTCFSCKCIIHCVPESYRNNKELRIFLTKHSTHNISLLDKNQIRKYSEKRYREFSYKLKKGVLCVQYC